MHSQVYHIKHLLLTRAEYLLCVQPDTVGSLHLFYNVSDFHLTNFVYSILNASVEVLLLGSKVYVGCLANVHVLLTLMHAHRYVNVCLCVQIILCRSVPEIMAVHVCVDRTRRMRAVRRNLQRTHCCCGASVKLMGILGSTFRTSQV
jgi:hypothetical protein